jgi:hypothetical protein
MSGSDDGVVTIADEVTPQPQGRQRVAVVRAWKATSAIARDPAGTASLIALLIGVVLSAVPNPRAWGSGVHSIGYALVGAAAFSFIYQYWANNALVRLITSTISKSQRRTFREVRGQWNRAIADAASSLDRHMDQLVSLHKRHWPLEVYPEGNVPNPDFNHMLESDLRRAARYDFRGQSGKHLASRLLKTRYPRLRVVRIVIEDATIDEVANARIDEKRWSEPERLGAVSDDEIRDIVKNDLFESMVGLYSARARFDRIEVVYAGRPTDVRVEITDGIVYVSPYIRNRPSGNRYPEVFRYHPESVPAQVAVLEFDREFSLLSGNSVVFVPNSTREVLREHLKKKGWNISYEDFDLKYRQAEQSLRALGTALSEAPGESG